MCITRNTIYYNAECGGRKAELGGGGTNDLIGVYTRNFRYPRESRRARNDDPPRGRLLRPVIPLNKLAGARSTGETITQIIIYNMARVAICSAFLPARTRVHNLYVRIASFCRVVVKRTTDRVRVHFTKPPPPPRSFRRQSHTGNADNPTPRNCSCSAEMRPLKRLPVKFQMLFRREKKKKEQLLLSESAMPGHTESRVHLIGIFLSVHGRGINGGMRI